MSRAEYVREIAPPAPPCFKLREAWLLYLESAADAQKPGRGAHGPVIIDTNGHAVFNRAFSFCHDCEPEHRIDMARQGKCRPSALRDANVLVAGPRPVEQPIRLMRPASKAGPTDVVLLAPMGLCGALA